MSTALSHAGPDRALTRLLELQADNAARELAVHVQRVLARHGVPADDGVDVLNGLAADDTSAAPRAGELGLLEAGVRRLERLEELHELRREAAEGRDLGREERVATGARLREEEERCEPGRLELVRHVRVPDRGLHAVVKLEVVRRVRVTVDDVRDGGDTDWKRGGIDNDNPDWKRGGIDNDNPDWKRGGIDNDNPDWKRGGIDNDNPDWKRGGIDNDNPDWKRGGIDNDNPDWKRGGFDNDNPVWKRGEVSF